MRVIGGEGDQQQRARRDNVGTHPMERLAAGGGEVAQRFAFEPVFTGEEFERGGELGGIFRGEEEARIGEGFFEAVNLEAHLAVLHAVDDGKFLDADIAVEVHGDDGGFEFGEMAGEAEQLLVIGRAGRRRVRGCWLRMRASVEKSS